MTAKEYLKQYAALNSEINRNLEKLAALRALSTSIPAPSGGGGSNSPSDRTGRIMDKIIDFESKINAKIDSLVDLKAEIEAAIDTVEDSKQREILQKRYISCKNWEVIAEEMHLDLRWVYRLHGKALQQIKIN